MRHFNFELLADLEGRVVARRCVRPDFKSVEVKTEEWKHPLSLHPALHLQVPAFKHLDTHDLLLVILTLLHPLVLLGLREPFNRLS